MFILALALLVMGCRCQVFQPPWITTVAGTPVRINCTQNVTSQSTMFWYRQRQEGPPEFQGSAFEGTKEAGTFTMIAVPSERATSLSKDRAGPGDSATYYCAVRDTTRQRSEMAAQKPEEAKPQPPPHQNKPSYLYFLELC